jgi:hypothetical protein
VGCLPLSLTRVSITTRYTSDKSGDPAHPPFEEQPTVPKITILCLLLADRSAREPAEEEEEAAWRRIPFPARLDSSRPKLGFGIQMPGDNQFWISASRKKKVELTLGRERI